MQDVPGNSECWMFSAGMEIVVTKNLEIQFGNVFEGFINKVL
jgi:hypothetical protein